jgi:hypothetical protein
MIKRDMPQSAWSLIAPVIRKIEQLGMFGEWSPGQFIERTPGAIEKRAALNEK